jgi:hypothetical protein
MKNKLFVIIFSCLILVIVVFGIQTYNKQVNSQPIFSNSTATTTPTFSLPTARVLPLGFKEYVNAKYHFSLVYPNTLSTREYKEDGDALTVTFEDIKNENEFQIFVIHYNDVQVTTERFKMDVPSGVMKEPTNVIVGNVSGTAFFSTNAIMGDTREVWFIKDGFLYEVTTHKKLDAWLTSITQTWKFIQ